MFHPAWKVKVNSIWRMMRKKSVWRLDFLHLWCFYTKDKPVRLLSFFWRNVNINQWQTVCCWRFGALFKSNTESFVSRSTNYEFNCYKLGVTKKNGQSEHNQTLCCTLTVSSPHKQQIAYFSTVFTYREQYYLTVLKPYWLSKTSECTKVHSKAKAHHMVTPALAGRRTWVQVVRLILHQSTAVPQYSVTL